MAKNSYILHTNLPIVLMYFQQNKLLKLSRHYDLFFDVYIFIFVLGRVGGEPKGIAAAVPEVKGGVPLGRLEVL